MNANLTSENLSFCPSGPVLRNYFHIAPTTENELDRAICIYTEDIHDGVKSVIETYAAAFTGPDTTHPWFYEKKIETKIIKDDKGNEHEVTYSGLIASPSAPVALITALSQAFVLLYEISAPSTYNLFIPIRSEEEFEAWAGLEKSSRLISYTGDVASIMTNAEALAQITGNEDVTQMLTRINPNNKDFPLWFQFAEVTKDTVVLTPIGLWSPIFTFALKLPMDKFRSSVLDGTILLWGSVVNATAVQSQSLVGDAVKNTLKEALK